MKKGFTLVELLIVLAVIAALMAVATPMAINAVATARASQVAQNMTNLTSAIQTAYAVKGLPTAESAAESKTYLAGYITSFPNGYEIAIDLGPKSSAAATIVYLLDDPAPDVIVKQNPQVQEMLGSDIDKTQKLTGLKDGTKYAVIEIPLIRY